MYSRFCFCIEFIVVLMVIAALSMPASASSGYSCNMQNQNQVMCGDPRASAAASTQGLIGNILNALLGGVRYRNLSNRKNKKNRSVFADLDHVSDTSAGCYLNCGAFYLSTVKAAQDRLAKATAAASGKNPSSVSTTTASEKVYPSQFLCQCNPYSSFVKFYVKGVDFKRIDVTNRCPDVSNLLDLYSTRPQDATNIANGILNLCIRESGCKCSPAKLDTKQVSQVATVSNPTSCYASPIKNKWGQTHWFCSGVMVVKKDSVQARAVKKRPACYPSCTGTGSAKKCMCGNMELINMRDLEA